MIRKILCICLLAVVSCGEKDSVPPHIMNEDKMTNVLLDIYILEGQVTNRVSRENRDSLIASFEILKEDIFEEHNVTDTTFRESLGWYFENPQVLDVIYTRVLDSLNLKMQQFKKPQEQPK